MLGGEVIRFYQVKNSPGIWSSPGEEQGRAFFHMLFKQFFYMASVQHRDLGFLISQVFQCEVGTVGLNVAEERRGSREKKIGEQLCDIKKYSQHESGLQLCKCLLSHPQENQRKHPFKNREHFCLRYRINDLIWCCIVCLVSVESTDFFKNIC